LRDKFPKIFCAQNERAELRTPFHLLFIPSNCKQGIDLAIVRIRSL